MGQEHGRRGGAGDHDPVQQPAQGRVAPGKGTLVQRRYAQGMPGGRPTPTQRRYGGMAAPAPQATPVQAKSAGDEAGQSGAAQQAHHEPMIRLSSSGLDFPEQQVGTRSEVQVVLVLNQGEAPLTLEEITAAFGNLDLFEIYPPTLPATVAPGGSVPIGVAFHPKQAGAQEAVVHIISGADHAELTLRGYGSEAAEPSGTSPRGGQERTLEGDVANIIGGRPLDGQTRPATKSVLLGQIGARLGVVFQALDKGFENAKGIIETIPKPQSRNWSAFFLRLAIEGALVGAAGPIGGIVGRIALARLPHAKGLADNLARVTRSVVKMTMQDALKGAGELREIERQQGVAVNEQHDPRDVFVRQSETALLAAMGLASDNFIRNVEPVLADEDVSYLTDLHEALADLSTSEAIRLAQTTSTLEQWVNFLARWEYGTWGAAGNVDTLGMSAMQMGKWAAAQGVLRIFVVNAGHWAAPDIQVTGMAMDGMSKKTRDYMRAHVKRIGDLAITKFINFRGPIQPSIERDRLDGAITTRPGPMTHTPQLDTVASQFIEHIDGSISLERTNDAGKAWLANYSNGFVGYCDPEQRARSPEEGAFQLMSVVDTLPMTTLQDDKRDEEKK